MDTPTIFIVSGGMGTSGEQLTRTALAQFEASAQVKVVRQVERSDQLAAVVNEACATTGMIVHTLVDTALREEMRDLALACNVPAIDLIGPLLLHLSRILGQEPLEQPGLYRHLREDYFKRIDAIEFTVAHDDGRKPHNLYRADIVLVGASRAGKTPLSMYLSTLGHKVANVPLIKDITPPEELFEIDRRRVVGLDIDPNQLITYRQRRQRNLGVQGQSSYTDPAAVYDEVEYARAIIRRGQFARIDITDKPIEESADEVIAVVNRRLRQAE